MGRSGPVGIRWGQVEVFSSDEKIDTIYAVFERIMKTYGAPGTLSKQDVEGAVLGDEAGAKPEGDEAQAEIAEVPLEDAEEEEELEEPIDDTQEDSPWLKAAKKMRGGD